MPRPAKIRLDLEPDPQVHVIGISCHENDYRLCWSLNRGLDLALTKRAKDIEDQGPDGDAHHVVFDHDDTDLEVRYTLVNNHGDHGLLVKDQRHVDFFLVVDDRIPLPIEDLLERVRRSEFVLAAFSLSFAEMRAGHKLLR
ncbi:MAG: IPExxxVDY family protein [Flavobacteriales bacterium]|nr:IPExxxVDY family protein [Flavobacteriales bacterium]